MKALRTKSSIPALKAKGISIPKDPPRKVESLDDLCRDCRSRPAHRCQRQALILAATQGIDPDDKTVPRVSLEALERKNLIQLRTSKKGRTSWRPTDRGRYLTACHVPVFLHRMPHRNYTSELQFAAPGEPEVMAA